METITLADLLATPARIADITARNCPNVDLRTLRERALWATNPEAPFEERDAHSKGFGWKLQEVAGREGLSNEQALNFGLGILHWAIANHRA